MKKEENEKSEQRRLIERAQVHITKLYEMGVNVEKVMIFGMWHAIHNGSILKAPIPPSSHWV